ncbi:NUDIX hydrolase [Xylanimonas cellulosilytica DSM 15894]|uniref:NUDIX hydrolase n=1 Tax=Xylanimonas cellulosilytica (strain DSM 15894 / JCM 12276 / CECT 5975 / KCTC 9989 / LMG 20990 / NBRC 107835 / XIL07) TaxID=446471 RepID=D1BVB9_XYLCX|nr:NUDIX domain-containing protein [Xylanimonas cellulosilytica]ACZ29390.1 NUDIX hydrolase [Xylanimonas cellulosilytica DSM 15894]
MSGIRLAVSTVIFALRPHPESGRPVLSIPLVRRTRDPFQGLWALPGGWVDPAESLTASAGRTLVETTGVRPSYLEQLYTFGALDRSPGERVVSVVYWALVRPDQIGERPAPSKGPAFDAENVAWFVADALGSPGTPDDGAPRTGDAPRLAFDHHAIVTYALWRLRTKVEYSAIAQGFLGSTFTLSELRQVHEAVLDRELDPANFRRQVEASGTIVATGEHVLGGRHRPPRLYRFDTSAPLVDNGPLGELTPGEMS